MSECGRQNNDPLQCHGHNPKTCEYITLQGNRNFADVIKLSILRWEIILGYPSGTM